MERKDLMTTKRYISRDRADAVIREIGRWKGAVKTFRWRPKASGTVAKRVGDKSEGCPKWLQQRRGNERTVSNDQEVERIVLMSPTIRAKNRRKWSRGSEDNDATSSAPPIATANHTNSSGGSPSFMTEKGTEKRTDMMISGVQQAGVAIPDRGGPLLMSDASGEMSGPR